MDYYQFVFRCQPEISDILIAFLAEQPFDTFEDTEQGFNAYLPANADPEAVEKYINTLSAQFDFVFEKNFLPAQNWNAVWESNFQPVVVGDFCAVRADFHPPFGNRVRHELRINPKMAFGTGHHETTWMCLAAMENLPFPGTRVLDYGCGTGILAILASKLGAAEVEAVDIEEESYRNTLENSELNGVANVVARCGTLDAVQGRDFDVVLANINRNVILQSLERLAAMTRPDAWLLTSGFLQQDEKVVVEAAAAQGFQKKSAWSRGSWVSVLFQKNA